MDKIIKLLTLDSLKGSRTKMTLIFDAVLYAVSLFAPQFLSPDQWAALQPFVALIAGYFGIEHFEKKS